MSREFYIKDTMQKIERENVPAVVYFEIRDGDVPVAMGFRGKSRKPSFNYRFRSKEQMDKHIEEFFKGIEIRFAEKIKIKKERKVFKTSLKKDDVLYASWGYEQTNIDFYQVIEVLESGKSVRIQEIAGERTRTYQSGGTTIPVKDAFVGVPMLKRIQAPYDSVTLKSYSSASKYDGRPKSWSDGY